MEQSFEEQCEELKQMYINNTRQIEKQLKKSKIRNIATIAVFTAAILGLTYMHHNTKLKLKETLKQLQTSEEKWKEIIPSLNGINTDLALMGADSITIQGVTYQRDIPDKGMNIGGNE